jgi:hypothetical protein
MHPLAAKFLELLRTNVPDYRVVDKMANALQFDAMKGAVNRTFGTLGENDFSVQFDYEGELGRKERNNVRKKEDKAVNQARWPSILHDVEPLDPGITWFEPFKDDYIEDAWLHPLLIQSIPDVEIDWFKHVVEAKDKPAPVVEDDENKPEPPKRLMETATGYWTNTKENLRTIFIKRAQRECVIDDELNHWNAIRIFKLLLGKDHPALRILKYYLMTYSVEATGPVDPFIVGQNITTTSNFRNDLLAPVRILTFIHWMHYEYVLDTGLDSFVKPLLYEVFVSHLKDPFSYGAKYKGVLSLITNALGSLGAIGIRVEYPEWKPGVPGTGATRQVRVYKEAPMKDMAAFERQQSEIKEAIAQSEVDFGPQVAALMQRLLGSEITSVPEIIRWHQIALYLTELVGYGRSNMVMAFHKQLTSNLAPGYSPGNPPRDPMRYFKAEMSHYIKDRMAVTGKTAVPTRAKIFQGIIKASTTKSAGVKSTSVEIELPDHLAQHLRKEGNMVKLTLRSKKAYLLLRGQEGYLKYANNGVIITIGMRVVLGTKDTRAIAVVPADIASTTRALFLDSLTEFIKERSYPISTTELAGDIADHAAIMAATGNPYLMAFMDDASKWDAHLIGEVWHNAFEEVMSMLASSGGRFSTPVLGFNDLEDITTYYLQDGNAWNTRLSTNVDTAPLDFKENPELMTKLAQLGIALSLLYPGLASGQIYTLLLNSLAHVDIKKALFNLDAYIKALRDMKVILMRVLGDDTFTIVELGAEPPTAEQIAEILDVVSKHYATYNQEINVQKSTANMWVTEYTKLRAAYGITYATYLTFWTHEKRQLQFPVDAIRNDIETVAANATRGCNIQRWMDVLLLRWLFLRRHRVPHKGDTYNIWLPFSVFVLPDGGANGRFAWPGFASGSMLNTFFALRDPLYTKWVHRFTSRSSAQAIELVAAGMQRDPQFKSGMLFVRKAITGYRSRLMRSRAVPEEVRKVVPKKSWFENSVSTFVAGLIATSAQLKNRRLALERHQSYLSHDSFALDVSPVSFSRELYIPNIVVRHATPPSELSPATRLYMDGTYIGQPPVYSEDPRMNVLYTLLGVRTEDSESKKEVNKLLRTLNRDNGVVNSMTPESILQMFAKVHFDEVKIAQILDVIGYSREIASQIISLIRDTSVYTAVVTESLLGSHSIGGQFEKFFSVANGFLVDHVHIGDYGEALLPFLQLLGLQYIIDYYFTTGLIASVEVRLSEQVDRRLMMMILKPVT